MLVAYKARTDQSACAFGFSSPGQLVQQPEKYPVNARSQRFSSRTSGMADPVATTTPLATTTTTTTGSTAGSSGLGLDPAVLEALRAAVQTEVRAALPLALPGSIPGLSGAATGTPLLPTASVPSGELTPREGRHIQTLPGPGTLRVRADSAGSGGQRDRLLQGLRPLGRTGRH